jgi:uncharacterized Tic20 family protein
MKEYLNWTNAVYVLVWLILVVLGLDLALSWLNLANTLANIGGLFLIFFIIFISVKTKAFTNFENLFKK